MTQLRLVVLLCLVAVCVLPTASHAGLNLAIGMTASDLSLGETLLVAGAASLLGFDTHVLLYYHNTGRMPYAGILTTLLFSRMFGADHHRISAWRSQGRGWGRIAKDLGVHPGAFNKLRRGLDIDRLSDEAFERQVMIWYLSEHYGVGQDRVHNWLRDRQPLLGILIGLDLGAKSHRSVSTLFAKRRELGSWNAVADKVGVGQKARKRPQWPKGGHELRAVGSGQHRALGQSSGQGQPGVKGSGQGKGQGQGRGHGRGRGHGQ